MLSISHAVRSTKKPELFHLDPAVRDRSWVICRVARVPVRVWRETARSHIMSERQPNLRDGTHRVVNAAAAQSDLGGGRTPRPRRRAGFSAGTPYVGEPQVGVRAGSPDLGTRTGVGVHVTHELKSLAVRAAPGTSTFPDTD